MNYDRLLQLGGIDREVPPIPGYITKEELKKDIEDINAKIPAEASEENQLADKQYTNDGISTATADFKGTFTTLEAMNAVTGNRNDYAYYVHSDAHGNEIYDRYKWVVGTGWTYEYTMNQVAAYKDVWIGAGATASDVMINANHHTSIAKGVSVEVTASSSKIWLILPEVYLPKMLMGGIDMQMTEGSPITSEGITYKVFSSDNQYSGTFDIVLV